jgi:hypothetical protein
MKIWTSTDLHGADIASLGWWLKVVPQKTTASLVHIMLAAEEMAYCMAAVMSCFPPINGGELCS